MKGFKFRLSAVLKLRNFEEEQELNKLVLIRNQYHRHLEEMAMLEKERLAGIHAFSEAEARGLKGPEVVAWNRFLDAEAVKKRQAEELKTNIEERLALQQSVLAEASARKKALEKLEESQKEAFIAEIREKEIKESEEMVILRKARERCEDE